MSGSKCICIQSVNVQNSISQMCVLRQLKVTNIHLVEEMCCGMLKRAKHMYFLPVGCSAAMFVIH